MEALDTIMVFIAVALIVWAAVAIWIIYKLKDDCDIERAKRCEADTLAEVKDQRIAELNERPKREAYQDAIRERNEFGQKLKEADEQKVADDASYKAMKDSYDQAIDLAEKLEADRDAKVKERDDALAEVDRLTKENLAQKHSIGGYKTNKKRRAKKIERLTDRITTLEQEKTKLLDDVKKKNYRIAKLGGNDE